MNEFIINFKPFYIVNIFAVQAPRDGCENNNNNNENK